MDYSKYNSKSSKKRNLIKKTLEGILQDCILNAQGKDLQLWLFEFNQLCYLLKRTGFIMEILSKPFNLNYYNQGLLIKAAIEENNNLVVTLKMTVKKEDMTNTKAILNQWVKSHTQLETFIQILNN